MPKSEKSEAHDPLAAAATKDRGLIGEFFGFLKENRKFWMLPILVLLLVFGALIILGGSVWAPFIYPLF